MTVEITDDRIDGAIAWYSKASRRNQQTHATLKIVQIASGAAIPVVAILMGEDHRTASIVASFLGALIVIIEGLQSTFRPLEKWLLYREALEALKRERSLFIKGAGAYRALPLADLRISYAERTEAIISNEHERWGTLGQQTQASK